MALTGEITENEDMLKGFTSLFTTKGYFPKAIFGGYIYKLKKDSVLEYPAYLIGKQIGVNVAEVALDGEYVKIKIFTNYSTSLVHASELKTYFDTTDEIYNILIKDDKYQDIINQLQRMYILIILLQILICTMIIMDFYTIVKNLNLSLYHRVTITMLHFKRDF